jgi:plasmid stabilization system protein ParE
VVADRIRRAVRNIGYFPGVGRLHERTGTREYLVRGLPYLLIYSVDDDSIEIIAVFHTSRDPRAKPGV